MREYFALQRLNWFPQAIYIYTHGIFAQHCSYISDTTAVADHMAYDSLSPDIFPVKISICSVKSNWSDKFTVHYN